MTCINCNCSSDEPGQLLTAYVNTEQSIITNMYPKKPITVILKPHENRFSSDHIETRTNPITILKIPFKSTVRVTSIITKSTMNSLKLFPTKDLTSTNYQVKKIFNEQSLNEHFCETFADLNEFREVNGIGIVFEGEPRENKIYYLAIKGYFVRDKQGPVIANYEKYSTEVLFKQKETFHYIV
ncbi:hypothetical protein GVAV_003191 [Gurleya vavrai]